MPTSIETYHLSRQWSEKPMNIGDIYCIKGPVQQVMASERRSERREWAKEIAGTVVLVACMAMFAVIFMVLE